MTQNILLRVAIIDNIKFVIHNYYISVYKDRFIHIFRLQAFSPEVY